MIHLLLSHPIALVALAAGYVLLVIEMCVPGFGVAGISGTVLAVLGLFLLQPAPMQAFMLVLIYLALLLIALPICLRRLARSRLVLKETATPEDADSDPEHLIGKTGAARTPLRPAGIAELDGVRRNVVTEGDFIEQGAPVRVVRASGNRIVVALDKSNQ